MIKTLRITTILAAILAGVFLILPIAFGVRSDPRIEKILDSPTVIERFKETATTRPGSSSEESPLVKQARAYALYLNPPPKPKPTVSAPRPQNRGPVVTVPARTVKFKVIATSFCQSNPQLSMALIDEPGKDFRWVMPSEKVGHFTIEEIKDGLVLARTDQGDTEQIPVESRTTATNPPQSSSSGTTMGRTAPAAGTASAIAAQTGRMPGSAAASRVSPEQAQAMDELVAKLRGLQKNFSDKTSTTEKPQDRATMMDKLLSDLKPPRVSPEEAKKLDDLGRELNDNQQDPNQAETRKIDRRMRTPYRMPALPQKKR